MDGLFEPAATAHVPFSGFGASPFVSRRAPVEMIELSPEPRAVRQALRAKCPRLPGVYGMLDAADELIYVGMSAQLRDRLLTYFTQGRPEAKEQRVAGHAARLIWEVGDHELAVQLRELQLIRHWRPRFNARGCPGRQEIGYIYLAAGAAPNLRVGQRVPQSAHHCWGPLPLGRRVRMAVRQLNYHFRLRDCPDRTPMRYTDQRMLLVHDGHPACLRGEIGTCLAPCSGRSSQADYGQGLAAARDLLDGRDTRVMAEYELAMQAAAERRAYEQAAVYRDMWDQLSFLHNQLQLLRDAQREHWFVYPITRRRVSQRPRATVWLLIAGGTLAAVQREPRTPEAARRCLDLLQQTYVARRSVAAEDWHQLRLVAAWFRQHPLERDRVLTPEQALAHCRERMRLRDDTT